MNLEWTTEKPQVPGWYWYYFGDHIRVAHAFRYDGEADLFFDMCSDYVEDNNSRIRWAGPIPEPKELRELSKNQQKLDPESEAALRGNLWNLYTSDEPKEPKETEQTFLEKAAEAIKRVKVWPQWKKDLYEPKEPKP